MDWPLRFSPAVPGFRHGGEELAHDQEKNKPKRHQAKNYGAALLR